MSATNSQVQNFSDSRIRPHAEFIRQLAVILDDDIASIDDVYNALNVQSPTWTDNRPDGPPHLLSATDILAINSLIHNVRDAIKNDAQYPVLLKACVNPPRT